MNPRFMALPWRSAALLIGAAALGHPAHAFEFNGYFRGGPGGTTVPNTARQCYGLAGEGLKYRLGNECDLYGEAQFSHAARYEELDYKLVTMMNFYNPGTDSGDSKFGLAQWYAQAKGFDFLPEANFWIGKRYYRNDVHIVDTFFVNMSGVGAGADGIAMGPGKFGVSYFKTDASATDTHDYGSRFHLDYYDLPVNPGGTMRFLGTFTRANYDAGTQNGTPYSAGTNGTGLSIEHNQENLFGLGIKNKVWLQFARGSTGLNQNFGTLDAPSSTKRWRVVESPMWQAGRFGGQGLAMYQEDKTDAGTTKSTSLGGRVSYGIARRVKLLAELGLSSKTPAGQARETMNKLTVGPALSLDDKLMTRPELRLYVTHARWNDAAANDAANGSLVVPGRRSGTSYGAQVEIWY